MEFLADIPLIGPVLNWTIPFLIVLSIVVAIHELGHLMVGRWCGIKAEVYSIGFGPVLWSRVDSHGTQWQIAALPLGGYVKFLGDMDPASAGQVDDEEIPPEDRHRAFHNAALYKRALTVLAGPVANFILSAVIVFGLSLAIGKHSAEPVVGDLGQLRTQDVGFVPGDRILTVDGTPIETFSDAIHLLVKSNGAPVPIVAERDGAEVRFETRYSLPPRIADVKSDGAAIIVGIQPGDIIRRVDDVEITSHQTLREVLAALPHNQEIELGIDRGGDMKTFRLTPDLVEREHPVTGEKTLVPTIGVDLDLLTGITPPFEPVSVGEAAANGVGHVWQVTTRTLDFIHAMAFRGADTGSLAGPIGIAKHSANAASRGFADFVYFMAFVSTAIGLFNLFPIPVLDGGHLCFYLYEALRGRPSNDAVVRYSTMAGLSLLLLLMVFVTFNNDLGLGEWFNQD